MEYGDFDFVGLLGRWYQLGATEITGLLTVSENSVDFVFRVLGYSIAFVSVLVTGLGVFTALRIGNSVRKSAESWAKEAGENKINELQRRLLPDVQSVINRISEETVEALNKRYRALMSLIFHVQTFVETPGFGETLERDERVVGGVIDEISIADAEILTEHLSIIALGQGKSIESSLVVLKNEYLQGENAIVALTKGKGKASLRELITAVKEQERLDTSAQIKTANQILKLLK